MAKDVLSTEYHYDIWDVKELDPEKLAALKKIKKRNWNFIVYPDSAPEDWRERLEQTGIAFAIGPEHNQDVNPTGEIKKTHYHGIACFDGPTTFANACSLIQNITKGPIPQVCQSLPGSYAYFTHKNNPEKYQYDSKDIRTYNGFEVDLTPRDVMQIKQELMRTIVRENFQEYAQFLLYVDSYLEPEYANVAYNNTFLFTSILKSNRHGRNLVKDMIDRIDKEIKDMEKRGK